MILVYSLVLLILSSCNKGFTLKIQDQDVLALGAQESCNFITTSVLSNTLRVSWKNATPATFIITSNVPTTFDSEIINAAEKWNTLIGKPLLTITRDPGFTSPPSNDGANGIYWMTEWEPENPDQQARTAVRWDVSKIVDADIRINAKNFQFFKTGESSAGGKINFESLILHELGHGLGLTHVAVQESVMQIYLAAGTVRNQPGATDRSSLKCEY